MDIFYYIFGPRLYMDYNKNSEEMLSLAVLEKIGDYLLNITMLLLKLSVYMSPILLLILIRRNNEILEAFYTWLRVIVGLAFLLVVAISFRGIGRYQSESYRNLIAVLKKANTSPETRKGLEMYDFDFRWWPVDFDARTIRSDQISMVPDLNECIVNFWNFFQYIFAYVFVHACGVHLLYPGTIRLLQSYLRPNLVEGRAELILRRNGHRYKVRTVDGNEIDTMFIDNRGRSKNGGTLLINSEGNMSFYEIGVTNTNISRSYSVLGWNHPGFEGSTGCPFPCQEFHAIDAVVKFAIHRLQFDETDILLYGWSIGGYSAVTGASRYNNLKGLILDGTFDDILHLANDEVPAIFHNFITLSVRCHCNLHSSELLKRYQGPVLIIRRLYDETISSDSRLQSNRTNNLLLDLLCYRYPNIFQPPQAERIKQLLYRPLRRCPLDTDEIAACWARLLNHVAVEGKRFPMTIGETYTETMRNQMAEFLLRKYCRDFNSSHCPPLEPEYFQIPWDGYTREPN